MASQVVIDLHTPAEESDYGSDFSPEEEEIVNTLLSGNLARIEVVEDNPIVNDVEYLEKQGTVRVPRVLGSARGPHGSEMLLEMGTAPSESGMLREQSFPHGTLHNLRRNARQL